MKKISFLKFYKKLGLDEDQVFFTSTILTGILAGLVAVFIQEAVSFLTVLFRTNQRFDHHSFLWGGLAIGISGYITTRVYTSTSGSGIPNVRIALAVYHGKLSLKDTIAKIITSILSLSSGITLGRQGPIVAITSGIGSYFGHVFHLSKKRVKALVAVGSAAGIAAGFNTPIAAVVFTLEEIVGDLNAKMLGSIVISSVVAAITATSLLGGDQTTLVHAGYKYENLSEIFYFITVGLLSAAIGPIWIRYTLWIRKLSKKIFKGHKLSIIMLTFVLIGGISQYNTEILGSGTAVINNKLLQSLVSWENLFILFGLKFILTGLFYSTGISGGLFMPAMFMGAILGSGIGLLLQSLGFASELPTSVFALIGMGSFFATVIRAPFTSILMIFELTRDYQLIIPLMTSNIIAYALSSKVQKNSIFEDISEQDGIHLPSRDDQEVLESLVIEDAMVKDVITFPHSMNIKDALQTSKQYDISGYPIMRHGRLYGMVSTQDLAKAYASYHGDDPVESICTKRLIHVYPDQNLTVAFHLLKKFHVSRLPVVSRLNDCILIGILSAEDIVNHFGYHIQEENKIEEVEKIEKAFEKNIKQSLEE